jgi:hypothetical protein
MKELSVIMAVILCLCFGTVYADPRMEVNDAFNHVILETGDTDNEVFIANTDPNIVVQGGVAWGFVDNMVKNPKFKDVFDLGVTRFSSESGKVCNMVDSNGTQYVSRDWEQIVRRHNNHPNVIYYRLECRNGKAK